MTPRELFDAFCDCALRRDGDGFAALCSDDVVLEFPFSRVRFSGRVDVRDRTVLTWRDVRRQIVDFQFLRIIEAGDVLVAEYDVVGYAGHRPFRAGAVLMLETRGGQISGLREYVDPSVDPNADPTAFAAALAAP